MAIYLHNIISLGYIPAMSEANSVEFESPTGGCPVGTAFFHRFRRDVVPFQQTLQKFHDSMDISTTSPKIDRQVARLENMHETSSKPFCTSFTLAVLVALRPPSTALQPLR